MAINLDRRIMPQTQLSGLKQVDASPFLAAGQGFAQFGKDIQNLGVATAEYLAQQQAIENDNLVNESLLAFEKEKNAKLLQIQNDPAFKKKFAPSKYGEFITKSLTAKQSELRKGLPKTRLNAFNFATTKGILAANTAALKQGKQVNDDEFKASTLLTRGSILDSASNPNNAFDRQTARNNYAGRVSNGVRTNVYTELEQAKLLEAFDEDLADTIFNRKERDLLAKPDANLSEIQSLQSEILSDGDLDPREKPKRAESLLTRWNTVKTRQRKAQEDIADEREFQAKNKIISLNVTDRNGVGASGQMMDEALDAAIADGSLRDAQFIKKHRDIAAGLEDRAHLGDEDNEPDKSYLDDLEKLKLQAISNDWTDVQLRNKVTKVISKANAEHVPGATQVITSVEMTRINAKASSIVKEFKTEGKANLESGKIKAQKEIRKLFGGSDQFLRKFNGVREELISDASATARLFIAGGDRWDVAVEKVRTFAMKTPGIGVTQFKGDQAAGFLEKARKGNLSDADRFILEAIRGRRIERESKRAEIDKQFSSEAADTLNKNK